MCFFRRKKAKPQPVVKEEPPKVEPKKEEVKPVEPKKAEVKPAAPKKVEAKPAPAKVEVKKEEPKPAEPETARPQKYHISQNNDEKSEFYNQWRVRKSGSDKTIKYFQNSKRSDRLSLKD
ncbi:MAG: hypothetical protein ACOX5X_01120 [Acholeplasmataceae bacterium]